MNALGEGRECEGDWIRGKKRRRKKRDSDKTGQPWGGWVRQGKELEVTQEEEERRRSVCSGVWG